MLVPLDLSAGSSAIFPQRDPPDPLPSYVALCHLLLRVLLFPVRDNTGPPQGAGRGFPQVTQLHREGLSKHDPW